MNILIGLLIIKGIIIIISSIIGLCLTFHKDKRIKKPYTKIINKVVAPDYYKENTSLKSSSIIHVLAVK